MPLIFAGWCRYLMAIDDSGRPFTPSPDPLLTELQTILAGVKLGDTIEAHDLLQPILANKQIFGYDLCKIGLAERVETYFQRMIVGPGAVSMTIQEALEGK